MPTFTDEEIYGVEVDKYYAGDGKMKNAVFFWVKSEETGDVVETYLTKEDLVKMLKMIGEEE